MVKQKMDGITHVVSGHVLFMYKASTHNYLCVSLGFITYELVMCGSGKLAGKNCI